MIISTKDSIQTFFGKTSGPTTTILVGVHGNERSGPLAVLQLLEEGFLIDKGTVHFIFANLLALEKNVRFVDSNMNRCFGIQCIGYEEQRVQEILPYLNQSDYLLDIHNTIDLSTPPFIICEHDDLVPYFDVPWNVQGLDDIHPGGSDGYMNSIGKKSVCLEVGSIVDNLEMTVAIAKKHISNFLSAVGNREKPAIMFSLSKTVTCRSIYYAVFGAFVLKQPLSEFQRVKKGKILGTDKEETIFMQEDGYLLFARNTSQVGEECFVVVE